MCYAIATLSDGTTLEVSAWTHDEVVALIDDALLELDEVMAPVWYIG